MKKLIIPLALAIARGAAHAQTVKIASVVELSGTGTTSGTNFRNGVELAVKEINAAGGILGRKLQLETNDTQSNPAVAKALTVKAIDDDVYVVMGPVFSGSIIVSMAETRRAEVPNFTGGEATNITMQGNPYVYRTSFSQVTPIPKAAQYIAIGAKAKTATCR